MTAGRWGTGRGVRVVEAGKQDRVSGWNWTSHPIQDTKAAVTTLRFTEFSTLRKSCSGLHLTDSKTEAERGTEESKRYGDLPKFGALGCDTKRAFAGRTYVLGRSHPRQ